MEVKESHSRCHFSLYFDLVVSDSGAHATTTLWLGTCHMVATQQIFIEWMNLIGQPGEKKGTEDYWE